MWLRLADDLRCPLCRSKIEVLPIEERTASVSRADSERGERFNIDARRLRTAIDAGLLLCRDCRVWFPILHGLPVLLPYRAALHEEFLGAHGPAVRKLPDGFAIPSEKPPRGEEFVLRSFSTEWLDYEYDGVLWDWTYEDREQMFLAEMGTERPAREPARFLEVGCGLGIVTSFAAKQFAGDAVGVDLSLAAVRASTHFCNHPFLHFVNASLWKLPFEECSFDLLYSHGVLHHTRSTEEAFATSAKMVRAGGRAYIWVYGNPSITATASTRIAYAVESVVRPCLARAPSGVTTIALAPFAVLYMIINRLQRRSGKEGQSYNYQRALHAARDRLTPLYAYRTGSDVVERWFKDLGFEDLHQVEENEVPAAVKESMRRNVGIRGRLSVDDRRPTRR